MKKVGKDRLSFVFRNRFRMSVCCVSNRQTYGIALSLLLSLLRHTQIALSLFEELKYNLAQKVHNTPVYKSIRGHMLCSSWDYIR